MTTGFIHNLNPVITQIGDVPLYYYGLAYAIGFVGIYLWFRFRRNVFRWSVYDVYDFSILFSICVLLGGRLFSVFVYHWEYYQVNFNELFSCWRGGMATHGVMLGGLIAMLIYARIKKVSFWQLADEIVIPAAFLMALGRIGNFINGQIVGTETTVWWGVQFPDVEGYRHPVTLYESAKNLMLIPILLYVRSRWLSKRGLTAATFLFGYGFFRIFTDLFRDHGAILFGIGRNQYFNGMMAVAGLMLMVHFFKMPDCKNQEQSLTVRDTREKRAFRIGTWVRQGVFVSIILFSLVIRSAWTPEVLEQRRADHQVNRQMLETSDIAEQELSIVKGELK